MTRGVIRAWSASDPKVIRYVFMRSGQVQCAKTHGKMRDPHWGTCTLYNIRTLACICLEFHCQLLCRVENSIAWHDMTWHDMHSMTWHGHRHDMDITWHDMTWHAWHEMHDMKCMTCHDIMPCHVMTCMTCHDIACHDMTWTWTCSCHVHVHVLSCHVGHLMSCHVVSRTSDHMVLALPNWL